MIDMGVTMDVIKNIVAKLKENKNVKAIYLFGSYAKGTQRKLSDIDICVVTERNISEFLKADISSYSSKKIDVSIFWDLPLSIRYKVLKDGKLLFSKDDLFLHRVKVESIGKYLDFKPIIDRQVKIVLGVENV